PTTNDQRPTTNDLNYVLISIIIPAHNTSQYIHRAIESSQRQTHSNIEIIIIDDGSTDDTLKISQSYAEKDSRIRIIHQDNAGVSSARNHGIKEANGKYIMFLDSDDWLEDFAVEFLLDMQTKNPDRLVTAEFIMTEYDAQIKKDAKRDEEIMILDSVEEAVSLWWKARLQYIHAKLFRADIMRQNSIMFREGINYGEDAVFVFDYLHETDGVIYSSVSVMNVLKRSDSATRKPYEQRKLFHDYPQLMIDHPDNTENVKQKLREYHTEMFMNELKNALVSRTDAKIITYLREKTKMYLNEYMNRKSIIRRAMIYIIVFMPVTIAVMFQRTVRLIRRLIP
ncbi:MAG: glycosyltransferase family 2 protein, partial [Synergistaceae bacterium]|nr:glycosyltransferase family 2 protein [Synergistaceae bacterium]